MLFTGEYEHTLDAKQRLAIPAEIRSRIDPVRDGDGFYVAPGDNGFLWIWPERAFERIADALGRSPLPAEELMRYEEGLFSQAAHLEIDKAGRVRLPDRLLRWAKLEQRVVILGIRDHLELRDPADWEVRREENLTRRNEVVQNARRQIASEEQRRDTRRGEG